MKNKKLALDKLKVNSFNTSMENLNGGMKAIELTGFYIICVYSDPELCPTGQTCPECAYTVVQAECQDPFSR